MTVYLGKHGAIELQRISGEPVSATLTPADVSVDAKRFSFADREVWGEFINGDQVDIERTDGGNLELIDGHNFPDWRGYIFVNQLGGMRLYDSFSGAIGGALEDALDLIEPSVTQQIKITTRNSGFNFLARIKGYEITTERDTVDITQLGEQFKQKYEAGLISGQGSIDCFWDHKRELCEPDGCGLGAEFPMYLAQLCIRLTQGADFFGRFFVYRPDESSTTDLRGDGTSVWYESECIVTNATVTVEATGIIESRIDFVTTKQIKLLTGVPPSYLLKEDGEFILQEDGISRLVLASSGM